MNAGNLLDALNRFDDVGKALKCSLYFMILGLVLQVFCISTTRMIQNDNGRSGLWAYCDTSTEYECCQSVESVVTDQHWIRASQVFLIFGLVFSFVATLSLIMLTCVVVSPDNIMNSRRVAFFSGSIATLVNVIGVSIYGGRYKLEPVLEEFEVSASLIFGIFSLFLFFVSEVALIIGSKTDPRIENDDNPSEQSHSLPEDEPTVVVGIPRSRPPSCESIPEVISINPSHGRDQRASINENSLHLSNSVIEHEEQSYMTHRTPSFESLYVLPIDFFTASSESIQELISINPSIGQGDEIHDISSTPLPRQGRLEQGTTENQTVVPGTVMPTSADEENNCTLCYEQPINVVLIPCGHNRYCSTCCGRLEDRRCPDCRAEITSIQRTYR